MPLPRVEVCESDMLEPDIDDYSPEYAERFVGATFDAVGISNNAYKALKAGRFEESVALNQKALDLKLQIWKETSIQAAISFNGLGEALLRAGRLQEADEVFQKALTAREAEKQNLDAAATRDNIGALREAQGRFEEAREMRLRGKEKGHMMCGNYYCPTTKMYALGRLSTCAACRSVFYCSKGCQKQDWNKRHKPLCKAYVASKESGNEEATPAN